MTVSTRPYVAQLTECCSTTTTPFPFDIYVTVEQFGAAADGVTDDTDAFVRALADGRPIGLDASKTYAIDSVIIPLGIACPGIFSIGGQARLVALAGATSASFFFNVQKVADFYFDNIFFDMPQGIPSEPPAFGYAIRFNPATDFTGTNYRVENCRFVGGRTAINGVGYVIQNSRFANNYCTGTFGDTIVFNAVQNVAIVDNTLEDSSITDGSDALTSSGAIRIGTATQHAASFNVEISRNIIVRCNTNTNQSAIDCASGSLRKLRVCDNFLDDNGNGIELKTAVWTPGGAGNPPGTPDVYEDLVVSGNTIRMVDAEGSSGIAAHHADALTVQGKCAKLRITGNYITCDPKPVSGISHNGIICLGYDDATIDGNTIIDTLYGMSIGGFGPVGDTADSVVVSNNTIDVVAYGIVTSAGTINHLHVRNNDVRNGTSGALYPAMYIGTATVDLDISDNRVEGLDDFALDLRLVTGGRIVRNTFVGATSAVTMGGTASTGVKFHDNNVVAAIGPAFTLSTGTIEIRDNTIEVPLGSRTWSGAATVTAAGNVRGMSAALPVGGGSLGDIFHDSTAATAGWRCTTAHATAATWTVI